VSSDHVRESEIVSALGALRARIAAACESVGRDPQGVTLVAVTKTFPATDVATLVRLGIVDIGENKDQEARAKFAELAELAPDVARAVRWHVVGQLQTNKARAVVRYASAVHSVDRGKLATALADAASGQRDEPLDVFLQVSMDESSTRDPARGGVTPGGLLELAAVVASRTELRLRGVMAVPPIDADPDAAFSRLAELSRELRDAHPGADAISAGMSGDLEAALRHGSTHLRVGSALLGRRAPNFG
jgi:PLP dependent protein